MIQSRAFRLGFFLILVLLSSAARAEMWSSPLRGSWVVEGESGVGDVDLTGCEIVAGDAEASPVKQAATFLAGDIERLVGHKPPIVAAASGQRVAIQLVTAADDGRWEASHIRTSPDGKSVSIVGSNPRGTAFGVYALCERLGVDPLHHWTGYEPVRRDKLVMRKTDHVAPPPTFKYRGLFHDDEDILPRPFEHSGYPLRYGDVSNEWYGKLFETALRLRMNMVAPYTRVHRRYEVQKMASDWGLFYTSHHYDILLSNPFGFNRFKLAERRGVSGEWDWLSNRENIVKYWRGGIEENKDLDCIWPVGLRGTDDYAYKFPKDMPEAEQNRIFKEVIDAQRALARDGVPPAKSPPVFHFTLYGEMLDKFLAGGTAAFDMPRDVIVIWPDDNDGRIRAVPKERGNWKHGVYYHAAYYGPVAKQSARIVPPERIANEFKRIVDAGATEYMLLNVSELREFVMETRMIADICFEAPAALADNPAPPARDGLLPHVPTAATQPIAPDDPSPAAERFVKWWSAEYFGADAAAGAADAYRDYHALLDRWDKLWLGSDKVAGAIDSLIKKFNRQPFEPARAETLPMLEARDKQYREAFERFAQLKTKMPERRQRQFFFENVELPLLFDWRPTQAAILLVRAMDEDDPAKAWAMCEDAMKPLEELEVEILRAERPPFDGWYRTSWIRHEETGLNVHRPYLQLRLFLSSGGKQKLTRPPGSNRIDVAKFLPVLEGETAPK